LVVTPPFSIFLMCQGLAFVVGDLWCKFCSFFSRSSFLVLGWTPVWFVVCPRGSMSPSFCGFTSPAKVGVPQRSREFLHFLTSGLPSFCMSAALLHKQDLLRFAVVRAILVFGFGLLVQRWFYSVRPTCLVPFFVPKPGIVLFFAFFGSPMPYHYSNLSPPEMTTLQASLALPLIFFVTPHTAAGPTYRLGPAQFRRES